MIRSRMIINKFIVFYNGVKHADHSVNLCWAAQPPNICHATNYLVGIKRMKCKFDYLYRSPWVFGDPIAVDLMRSALIV